MTETSLFTCITCRVGFHDSDLQRSHYKSDWHRYNLKRKVISLDPVTLESFEAKVRGQEAISKESEGVRETLYYCTVCRKSYSNLKAYSNHLASRKHIQEFLTNKSDAPITKSELSALAAGFDDKSLLVETKKKTKKEPMGGDDDDEWENVEGESLSSLHCLFCDSIGKSIDKNIEHMSRVHSFFIPDIEYCVDIGGLLEYLGEKVGEGFLCIWCNEKGKSFYDLQSVQRHMIDKGHCKILHDSDAMFEYADYYDYSPSYPDGIDVNADEVYQPEMISFNDNMQLVLPSGVVLGHRALKIYYKQYLRRDAKITPHGANKKNQLISSYQGKGYSSGSLIEAQKKYRDQKVFKYTRDKYFMKLGVMGNKNMQTHFRRQIQF